MLSNLSFKTMKRKIIIAALFFISSFLSSCIDEYNICDQSKSTDLAAGFYQKNGTADIVAVAPVFTFTLLNSTSPYYNQQANVSKFSFALIPAKDSAKYFIQLSALLPADTITIFYSSQYLTLSQQCGTVPVHILAKTTSTLHTIDSVKIINATVNTTSTENLKIYF